MKKLMVGLAAVLLATGVLAVVQTNIVTYVSSYKLIPSSCTNVGVTGLSTGKAYMVIAVTNVPGLTESTVRTNGDFRLLVYALSEKFYNAIQAQAITNQPTHLSITRSLMQGAGVTMEMGYGIKVDLTLGTVTIPGE